MRLFSLLLATSGLALCAGAVHAQPRTTDGSTEVDEVIVTAAPYPVSIRSVTTSVNVVNREQLDVAPAVGLGDLLSHQPGLRSTFFGPGASRPVIRGLSGPRVLVLQNGTGLVDASSLSPDHAVASEPSEAQRIEVLRGPSTLAYGGSAIGGVVNIIDDRVPSSPTTDGIEGRANASHDFNNDGRAVSLAAKLGSGRWVVALDAAHRRAGDYEAGATPVSTRLAADEGLTPLTDRTLRNTFVDLDAYGIGLSYIQSPGNYLGASVKRTNTQYGIPHAQVGGPVDPAAEGPVYIDLKQTRWDLRGEHAIDLGPFDRARFSVGYADYEHAEISVDTGDVGTRFLSNGTEGRLDLVQRGRDGWQGAVGFQGLRRDFQAIGDEAFVPSSRIGETAVYGLQRLDRDAWGFEGGLRLEHHTVEADLAGRPTSQAAAASGVNWATAGAAPEFTNGSVSGAVFARTPGGLFAGLSLSYNRRAPTEFELFADGPHEGTHSYEVGDPTLRSEAVVTLEGTLRWSSQRAHGEAHLFGARYDGYIEEAPTGQSVDDAGTLSPTGELPVFRYFQTGATFHGGELAASYDLTEAWGGTFTVDGQADYVRGETDGGVPARIPPWSVTGALTWHTDHSEVKGEVVHVAEQDRVAPFEPPTDAYTLVNASLSVRPFHDRSIRLFAEGHNLTDQEAREHASFLKDIAPLPGRAIRMGVAVRF